MKPPEGLVRLWCGTVTAKTREPVMSVGMDYRDANRLIAFSLFAVEQHPDLAGMPLATWTESVDGPESSPVVVMTFHESLAGLVNTLQLMLASFNDCDPLSRKDIVARLLDDWRRLSLANPESVRACEDVVYEAYVFAKLAALGLGPRFVKAKRGRKCPDIEVPAHHVLIECKNLRARGLEEQSTAALVKRIAGYAKELDEKCAGHDPTGTMTGVLCVDLPPHFGGYFRQLTDVERFALIVEGGGGQADGNSGSPGSIPFLFTETTQLPGSDGGHCPAERWYATHNLPLLMQKPSDPFTQFYWELMLGMGWSPLGVTEHPALTMSCIVNGRSLSWLQPALVRKCWMRERRAMGLAADWLAIPPVGIFGYAE